MGALGRGNTGKLQKLSSLIGLVWQMPSILVRASKFSASAVYSSQQSWDIAIADFIARRMRVPRIAHLHYAPGPWLGQRSLDLLLSSPSVICVSDFIGHCLCKTGKPLGKLSVVNNPVFRDIALSEQDREQARGKLRSELSIPADAVVIGMVGALSERKGQKELIQAFARVAERLPKVHLVLVGGEDNEGDDFRSELVSVVQGLELITRVHFLGQRKDVPQLLASFDIFAHPSYADACPLAVLEASCAVLPVVAWADGGVVEIVENGVTGLLAPTRNIQELAENLEKLGGNLDLAKEMGTAGRARVMSQFSLSNQAGKFFDALLSAAD